MMVTVPVDLQGTSGNVDNTGTYVYSWRYNLILQHVDFTAFKGMTEEMARRVHGQIVQGIGSQFLEDYMPIWEWNGGNLYQPLTGKRQKIPQCIHIRPRHWYVFMDGPKPVKVEDRECLLARKGS